MSSNTTAPPAQTSEDLFPPALIPTHVLSSLPEGYTARPLRRTDHTAGFLDVLRVLTTVGEISAAEFEGQFDSMRGAGVGAEGELAGRGGSYFILVVLDGEGVCVGTGALVVERKFIHNLGKVGHIEDIAVAKTQQGKKLGLRIIQALDGVAERVGCYKSILDCSEANEGFYVKCGFKRAGLQMAHYYEGGGAKAHV